MGKNIPLSLLSSEKQLHFYIENFSSMKRNRDTHENVIIGSTPHTFLGKILSQVLDLLVFQERYVISEGGYNVKFFCNTLEYIGK